MITPTVLSAVVGAFSSLFKSPLTVGIIAAELVLQELCSNLFTCSASRAGFLVEGI